VGRTNATGERLKEAQAINLSLSALGNCIGTQKKEGTKGRRRDEQHMMIDWR
jgi:hypothetical protein